MVSENTCTICPETFHTQYYEKYVAIVPLFSETSHKEFSNILCEKISIIVKLVLKLKIFVFQGSEDGKESWKKMH